MAREALWNALHEAERYDVLANTAFMPREEALDEVWKKHKRSVAGLRTELRALRRDVERMRRPSSGA